nr:hypothetical protein GCM10020092_005360 [Actinoplanes digitatis]
MGSTPETLATRYVGRAATPETVNLIAHKLGFYDPLWLQYGRWVKGIFLGAEYDYGAGVEHCPAPCFGYSFVTHQPVWPDLLDRLPVTLSLAVGASVLWLVFGLSTGVVSALRRGSVLDRAAMSFSLAGCLPPPSSSRAWSACWCSATSSAGRLPAAPTRRSPRARSTGPTPCCCRGWSWRCNSPPSTRG